MKPIDDYRAGAERLQDLLGLSAPPLAITFADSEPEGIPYYGAAHPEPTADGRTGSVPAGCVFWIKGTDRTFATRPEDYGNCSVGSLIPAVIDNDPFSTASVALPSPFLRRPPT